MDWKGDKINSFYFSLHTQANDYSCHHFEVVEKIKVREDTQKQMGPLQDNSSTEAFLFMPRLSIEQLFYFNNLGYQGGSNLEKKRDTICLITESKSTGT